MLRARPPQKIDRAVGIVAHLAQHLIVAVDGGDLRIRPDELAQFRRGTFVQIRRLAQEPRTADLRAESG